MIHKFTSPLRSLAHLCSDFGSYMVNLQRRCLKRGANGGCEGGPSADDAQRGYRTMLHEMRRFYYF